MLVAVSSRYDIALERLLAAAANMGARLLVAGEFMLDGKDGYESDAPEFDRIGGLAPITAPCLALGGTEDVLTPPKYHRYLAESLPRAQLVLVEGRGHMLPWEDPQGFARQVRVFAAAC